MHIKRRPRERETRRWLTYAHTDTFAQFFFSEAASLSGVLVDWASVSVFVFVCVRHRMVDPSAAVTETDGEIPASSGK